MILRALRKYPTIAAPLIAVGMELTKDISTKEYIWDLGKVAKEVYLENRDKGRGRLVSALKAGNEVREIDQLVTELRAMNALATVVMPFVFGSTCGGETASSTYEPQMIVKMHEPDRLLTERLEQAQAPSYSIDDLLYKQGGENGRR